MSHMTFQAASLIGTKEPLNYTLQEALMGMQNL